MGRPLDQRAQMRMGCDRVLLRPAFQLAETELRDLFDDGGIQASCGDNGSGRLPSALQRAHRDRIWRLCRHCLSRGFRLAEAKIGEQHVLLADKETVDAVSYTHLRAHETDSYLVC